MQMLAEHVLYPKTAQAAIGNVYIQVWRSEINQI
jgi:hypothetical protein